MSNKDIVLRQWYQELWDNWNVSTADELFTDNYRLHLPGSAAALDRDATKGVEMVAEGNTVAARWSVRGTHRGEFQGIAPNTMDLLQQLGAVSASAHA